MDLGGSCYSQILICLSIKNILAMKSKCSGCMLASGWQPVALCLGNGLNIIMACNGQVRG